MLIKHFEAVPSTGRAQTYHLTKRFLIQTTTVLLLTSTIVQLLSVNSVHSLPTVPSETTDDRVLEPITLEEAFLGELRAKDFDFEWLAAKGASELEILDQIIYEESKNLLLASLPSIERRNGSSTTQISGIAAKNQQVLSSFQPVTTVLVSNTSLLSSIEFQGYKISPSKRYLLLWNSRRKQFRHSSTAKYFLYDIEQELISILGTKDQTASQDGTTSDDDNEFMRFQVADWYATDTPDGSLDSLVLIQNNDIYSLYDVSRLMGQRKGSSVEIKGGVTASVGYARPKRLTYTGREGIVFNGVPDWLYEEEILGDTPAYQVSPASNHIAYMTFNDSTVNIMPLTIYGDRVIPRIHLIRYPKTGQPNPKVTVHVVENFSQTNGQSLVTRDFRMNLPDDLEKEQHYINRINWLTNEKLALIWSSRNQNDSVIVICTMQQASSSPHDRWKCEKNLQMRSNDGWLDISDDISPLNSDSYLALIPKFEGSQVGYFKHIAKVSLKQPNTFVHITSGAKEVTSINGIDYKRSLVYYTSTVTNKPNQRHLFVTELDSTSTHPNATLNVLESASTSVCVTCDHHPDCTYNYAKMSPSTNYYMFHCSGPGVPRTELRATRRRRHRNFFENLVNDTRQRKLLGQFDVSESNVTATPVDSLGNQNSPSLLHTYEDNKKLREKLENHKIVPATIRLHVPINDTNYLAQVSLLLPQNLSYMLNSTGRQQGTFDNLSLEQAKNLFANQKGSSKFPMVVDVYGGPGSQKVDDRFSVNFGHYLASSERIIYATIDGRGSGFQGSNRLYELYHRLGTVEIQDQIDVAAEIAKSFWFIDSSKVAIWGWSYGGYAAAMSLAQSKKQSKDQKLESSYPLSISSSTFKCAASVAPVTNWIYYDTAYTEKYMSSPWSNEKYDDISPGDHLEGQLISQITQNRNPLIPNKWTPLNQTLQSSHIRYNIAQQLLGLIATDQTEVNKNDHHRTTAHTSQQTNNKMTDLNDRYRRASLLDQAASIDPNSFLLVHGTADDNVNFQQSIMLMKRLIKKNIQFESRLYPDQDHGIAEKADKLHLGMTLSKFLIECLG